MLLAKTVGAKGILVRTGQQDESAYADVVVDDLDAVINYIRKWSDE